MGKSKSKKSENKGKHKLPTINILGEEYTISRVEPEELPGKLGECDASKKMIKIVTGQDENDIRSTLYHEIGHAILYESAIFYGISYEAQEVIAEQFAKVFSKLKK